jgi:hypothetical protein
MKPKIVICENTPLGKPRKEDWNGRAYLVAPVTMIVPGVLNGSQGPIYYSAEENAKSVYDWNGMPLVMGHPTSKDGTPVTARDPDVLRKTGVGAIYQTSNDAGKLQAEAWFDVEETKRVSPNTFKKLNDGKPIEVSTGLGLKLTIAPAGSADDKGRVYNHTAYDYKPDHLAVLENEKGACSIEDGCGIMNKTLTERLLSFKDWLKSAFRFITLQGIPAKQVQDIAVNYEKSYGEKRNSLDKQLFERYAKNATPFNDAVYPYLVDMYDGYVVFRNDGKYYKLGYTEAENKCTLNQEDPVEVERITVYEPVDNTKEDDDRENVLVIEEWVLPGEKVETVENIIRKLPNGKYRLFSKTGKNLGTFDSIEAAKKHEMEVEMFKKMKNQATEPALTTNVEGEMDRTATINWLVANCDCWKSQEDKEILNKMTDAKLKQLKDTAEQSKAAVTMLVDVANAAGLDKNKPLTLDAFKAAFKPAEPPPVAQPVVTTQNNSGVPGLKEWESSMPPEAQAIWNSAKQVAQREKDMLIAALVFNMEGPERTKMIEFLNGKTPAELQVLVALKGPKAQVQEPAFPGTNFLLNGGGPLNNRYATDKERNNILELPSLYDDEEVA